ncbi:MAG: hypothetical protein A2559_07725 [Deltaproteobacteria bacterium RIFOXYD2_FULL_66_9]|nr:MAG: hypothetical protein A2559_07725 [Deltaproteobacteria bacterium RIFOXYD2_FULL_66_9]
MDISLLQKSKEGEAKKNGLSERSVGRKKSLNGILVTFGFGTADLSLKVFAFCFKKRLIENNEMGLKLSVCLRIRHPCRHGFTLQG